eukprot:374931_1
MIGYQYIIKYIYPKNGLQVQPTMISNDYSETSPVPTEMEESQSHSQTITDYDTDSTQILHGGLAYDFETTLFEDWVTTDFVAFPYSHILETEQ